MDIKKIISDYIDKNSEKICDFSDKIWEYAEAGMKEYKSAELFCKVLKEEGFEVSEGVSGIPTAFIGTYGKGKPIIGFLAEYDALPGLSQKGCTAKKEPLVSDADAYGHGCGHNLLGAGALAAAFAVKHYLAENNLPGTVRLYGCPGEEYGSGKTFMARDGLFDDTDACITWHPGDHTNVVAQGSLANYSIFFKFHGKTAHAAGAPHLGRSALDACELMNVGVNYLREHVVPEARMHYAYRDVGGIAPNVVQDHAELHYFIRAPRVALMMPIVERVCDVARGAALMSGTTLEIVTHEALSDFLPNDTLNTIMHRALTDVGAAVYDEHDNELARQFRAIVTPDELANCAENYRVTTGGAILPDCLINAQPAPLYPIDKAQSGSTDVGDVSYCTPTAQFGVATVAAGTPGHAWQLTAQGVSSYAHKGMLNAAKAMALAGIYAMNDTDMLARAKAELLQKNGGKYECPLPNDIKPIL